MIRIYSGSESVRNSAFHLVRAFLPEKEAVQEHGLPPGREMELSGREFLYVADDSKVVAYIADAGTDHRKTDLYLYDILREKTGKDLPWGVLTGVRPVKLAMAQLDRMSDSEFISDFRRERRVSEKKAVLSRDIARREREIIRNVLSGKDRDPGSCSIYIGIPVCPSICSYCSFSSGPLSVWKDRLDDYVDALVTEMTLLADRIREHQVTSVYIGGGTPTVLNERQLQRLLDCVQNIIGAGEGFEYTLEAGRPDTITREKLLIAKDHGVNRISINPQTMQQRTLDLVGRRHTVEEVEEAFTLARELGFDNINMDIIAGLPGENAADMQDTISKISNLAPESLTVHALAIKRAAAMDRLKVEADVIDEMIETASEGAALMGMSPYYLYRQKSIAGNHENTGYAVPGKECIYNVMIMEEVQSIFAFGAGATSKVLLKDKVQNPDRAQGVMTELIRHDNPAGIPDYIARCREMAKTKEKTFDIT